MKRFDPEANNTNFEKVNATIPNVSEKVLEEIDTLVRAGEKVKAIALYREHTGQGLADAKNAIDSYCLSIANGPVKNEQDFSMTVSDSFYITGRGIIVAGYINSGNVNVGESVNVNGEAYTVSGIEMFRKQVVQAEAGMTVGLLLSGLTERILSGTIISK